MTNVYDILMERGYIKQTTHEDEIRELLGNHKITFYIGFDPTADSLHVGHFVQMMVMAHMQKAGHRPIALLGGGTAMIGDPTGKTDMRKILTQEQIQHNAECFKKQFSRLIDFSGGKAIMENNSNWLLNLNYVNFLREIGVHFSVNKMLTAECYKQRLERGLTFLEFNYMLMQAYDFLQLNKKYNCVLEMGGDDQWSNILAGVDLIRRKEQKPAYGMTFTLLTKSDGKKMGKTEGGAIWLDKAKTSPYEFYQYWRNVDDSDVEKCLAMLTFLPMDEVKRLGSLRDSEINRAKEILAYEVTKLIHGKDEADKARSAAEALFSGGSNINNIPTIEIDKKDSNSSIVDLLVKTSILSSKSEARRLIKQGGLTVNNNKVSDINFVVNADDFKDGSIMIRRGKKKYNRLVIKKG